jgi:hypothetical protein
MYVAVVWLICVLIWSALTALIGGIDSSVLLPAFITGVIVIAAVSQICSRWNRPRASVTGLGIGLIPTLIGLLIGFLSPKTVDASVAWMVLSLWLIVPNGLIGAIGGFAASRG